MDKFYVYIYLDPRKHRNYKYCSYKGLSQKEISLIFNITRQTIWSIKHVKTWSNIKGEL